MNFLNQFQVKIYTVKSSKLSSKNSYTVFDDKKLVSVYQKNPIGYVRSQWATGYTIRRQGGGEGAYFCLTCTVIKDYYITGRANPISCAAGLR